MALLALAACAPGAEEPAPVADLLSPASVPTLLRERGEIAVTEPVFYGGFHGAEEPAGGPAKRWLGDEPGQILISFIGFEPRPRRLGVELRARPGSTPRVQILFDDVEVGVIEPARGWGRHLFELPARSCGFGQHLLELRPQTAPAAGDAPGRRPRSVVLRRVWLEPGTTAVEAPRRERRALLLPPGTAASWAFWVPAGGGLEATWTGGEGTEGATPFTVLTDDAPPERLGRPDLSAWVGRPIRLVAMVPHRVSEPLQLSRLRLTRRRPAAPGAEAAPVTGKGLLVVGALAEGFPVSPCSPQRERALRCLLSGREAAALGFPDVPVFDHVGDDPEAVARFLESSPAPVVAALVLGARPARAAAERLRRRLDGLAVLMAELPSDREQTAVLAAGLEPAPAPVNARDLDLTATLLAAAGVARAAVDGVDLRPALSGRAPATVRPVAPVWLADRSVAVVDGRRFELGVGEVRPAASVLEASALAYLRRRRRALGWLEGERTRLVRPGRRTRAAEP